MGVPSSTIRWSESSRSGNGSTNFGIAFPASGICGDWAAVAFHVPAETIAHASNNTFQILISCSLLSARGFGSSVAARRTLRPVVVSLRGSAFVPSPCHHPSDRPREFLRGPRLAYEPRGARAEGQRRVLLLGVHAEDQYGEL